MPRDIVLPNKTFVVSVLLIFILALSFFGGLYFILYEDKFKTNPPDYKPVTREPVSLFLEINSPEDDILVTDPNLIISGKTRPETTIIISSQDNDAGVRASKQGEFNKIFELSPGANIVEITVFDDEGKSKTVTRSIYHSKEKI